MLNKTLRLSALLLVASIFLAGTNSYASSSFDSPQKIESSTSKSTEKPSAIKSIVEKIKQAVISGNNKINSEIAKISGKIKQVINKDNEPDISKQVVEPKKLKLANIPKKFIKNINVNTVEIIAGRLKAAISSGDYNLMASIIRTTPADLLGSAISTAINDDPLVSVPLAKSVHENLPSKMSFPVINNMASQLERSNYQDVAVQVNQVTQASKIASNQAALNTSSSSGFELVTNSSVLPTISGTIENPFIASTNFRP